MHAGATLPLPCVSTVFVTETLPFIVDFQRITLADYAYYNEDRHPMYVKALQVRLPPRRGRPFSLGAV